VVNHQPLVILAGAFDNTDPSVFSTVTLTSFYNKGACGLSAVYTHPRNARSHT